MLEPLLADYQHLGIDIDVTPDLQEDEILRVEGDCLVQDLINGWTQPTGIADGTVEGAQWGIDLRASLNRGFTIDGLFALKVSMEVQAQRDDRVAACTVALTATTDGALIVRGVVETGAAPYPFSFRVSLDTVGDLYVERLGP